MEYLFFKETQEVGGETRAYCASCKSDTLHTIVTMFEGEVRSGQCTICNASHAYRPPRGDGDEDVPEPIAVRRRQALRKLPWGEVIADVDSEIVPLYSVRDTYTEGDIINHASFGLGYISERVSDTKLEAIFEDGQRILVYNRKDLKTRALTKRAQAAARCTPGLADRVSTSRASNPSLTRMLTRNSASGRSLPGGLIVSKPTRVRVSSIGSKESSILSFTWFQNEKTGPGTEIRLNDEARLIIHGGAFQPTVDQ